MDKKTIFMGVIGILLILNMILTYSCLYEIKAHQKLTIRNYDLEMLELGLTNQLNSIESQIRENNSMLLDIWSE